jgi:hypothetical protein
MGYNFAFRSKTQIGPDQDQIGAPTGPFGRMPAVRVFAPKVTRGQGRGDHAPCASTMDATRPLPCHVPMPRSAWWSTRATSPSPSLLTHSPPSSLPHTRTRAQTPPRPPWPTGHALELTATPSFSSICHVTGQLKYTTISASHWSTFSLVWRALCRTAELLTVVPLSPRPPAYVARPPQATTATTVSSTTFTLLLSTPLVQPRRASVAGKPTLPARPPMTACSRGQGAVVRFRL